LLAAAAREFSAHGYAATTAKSIAARARVATGSFYQYFANKDVALRELAAGRAALASAQTVGLVEHAATTDLPDDPVRLERRVRDLLRTVVLAVIALHRDDPGLHAVLSERRHADPDLDALTSAQEATLVGRVGGLLRHWGHRGDADATAFVLFGMLEGTVHAHVLGHAYVDDARLIESLTTAMLRVALPSPLPS
jgi:AcrR family transcriptional regulator